MNIKQNKKKNVRLKIFIYFVFCSAFLFANILLINRGFAASIPPLPNPVFTESCGIDIALVVDTSNSIDDNELSQMKEALICFVNSLSQTSVSNQFSLTQFGFGSSIVQPLTPGIDLIKQRINSMEGKTGATNWSEGIAKAKTTFDPTSTRSKLLIFITDHSPNYSNCNGGYQDPFSSYQCEADLNSAIIEANNSKNALGVRIFAVGVGSTFDPALEPSRLAETERMIEHLKLISGPNGSDPDMKNRDFTTSYFDSLSATLYLYANSICKTGVKDFSTCISKTNGVCGLTTNSCTSGTFIKKLDDLCNNNWECRGLNGGAKASCSTAKPAIDGVCSTSAETCTTGTYQDLPADTATEFQWTCLGVCGADSGICKAKKISEPPIIPRVIPGECGQPSYFGQYTWCALIEALNKAFQIFLYVFAPIATLMLVWGGIVYITSNGKEEKTKQAKKIILYTVIGIVIVTAIWGLITLAANSIPK